MNLLAVGNKVAYVASPPYSRRSTVGIGKECSSVEERGLFGIGRLPAQLRVLPIQRARAAQQWWRAMSAARLWR